MKPTQQQAAQLESNGYVVLLRGDVFVFNDHCWHTDGENSSLNTRCVVCADKLADMQDRRQRVSAETLPTFASQENEFVAVIA